MFFHDGPAVPFDGREFVPLGRHWHSCLTLFPARGLYGEYSQYSAPSWKAVTLSAGML